jgi:AcrR family transcriptional regulator
MRPRSGNIVPMSSSTTAVVRGRPREFDVDEAIDRALAVFRQKGYEGTSLTDLTDAMGISRPSLYAAYGGKESLFRKVLERYVRGPGAYFNKALQAPTAREAAERLLAGEIDLVTGGDIAQGCLMVQGALTCGEEAEPVRRELASWRRAKEVAIRKRFEHAKATGDLPNGLDPADFARYFATVLQGLSVQAAGGAKRDDLLRVAETAMRVWPKR